MPEAKNQEKKAQVKDLVAKISSEDPEVRTAAWLAAGKVGPAALKPLARVVAQGALEVSRAATRAMWTVVHTVGAPGGKGKPQAVKQLSTLLEDKQPLGVRRDAVWMLSELSDGGDEVQALAALLANPDLREDARCALQRIPGEASLAALKVGMEEVPEDFKYALADSLRRRGVKVAGYPSKKLAPVKKTKVQPVGRA